MTKTPKLLTEWQVADVLRNKRTPETLTKPQLLQVLQASQRDLFKVKSDMLHRIAELETKLHGFTHCDQPDCDAEAFVRRCKEHAGEPTPHRCDYEEDMCDKPATIHRCPDHATPECECGAPSTVHECAKCHKPKCTACSEEVDVENEEVWCEKCANADRGTLDEIVELLEEPANSDVERLYRKHAIERLTGTVLSKAV